MPAHSAGAYNATLLVMVNVIKGVGVHPPPSPARANFTLMTECTPESSGCNSVYSVVSPYCSSAFYKKAKQGFVDQYIIYYNLFLVFLGEDLKK